jgi:hypothetical protein
MGPQMGLLYLPQMIDDSIDRMIIGRGKQKHKEKNLLSV